jgi:AraC family transcriptional regulator
MPTESKLARGQFYGKVSRRREVSSFILTETAYHSGYQLPRHSHERAYLCFVLKGRFSEFGGARSHDCKAATLIFHAADDSHSDHFLTDSHCFNIQFDSQVFGRNSRLDSRAQVHSGAVAHLAIKLYREFCMMDEVSELAIEGLGLEILADVARSSKRTSDEAPLWLERVRELLHDRFAERLTIAEVAASVGVHPAHLAREFRRRHQQTIGDYVRHLRIEFARQELHASDKPISEIAIAAGFFDQSHFTRIFKLITGVPPAAFRNTFKDC